MTASSTKGTKICFVPDGTVGAAVVPTAISNAAPAEVTVAAVTGMLDGDVVKFADGATGFAELDGKEWIISNVNSGANTFELLGSDTTNSTGTLVGAPSIDHYADGDFVCPCFSEITFNPETPDVISVATFCDPSASIASQVVGAGTIDFAGYIDVTEPAYRDLIALKASGANTIWRIQLGNNQGYIVFDGAVGSLSIVLPIDGAQGYAGTIALASEYRHLF